MDDVKITKEQAEILDRLFEMEVNGDDPCLNKRTKKALIKQIKQDLTIPNEWWYELMETIGTKFSVLDRKEKRIIKPIYYAFSRSPME